MTGPDIPPEREDPEYEHEYDDRDWMDDVEFDDHCSRNADVGEEL